MTALGQLVAGIAHEINNPVNFIPGNLVHTIEYSQNLLNLIRSTFGEVTEFIIKIPVQLKS